MTSVRQRLGALGERLARQHLERLGYQVLEANYRVPTGELDLVALEGGYLVFVEVRTRRGRAFGTPEESVDARKAQRLSALAEEFAQRRPDLPRDMRIDLVAVEFTLRGKLERIEVLRNVTG
ncbi:MAG: YraN family protein [Chloroflexi bacterium]|nr:YraN family protein [Chloroflexota bacterium]